MSRFEQNYIHCFSSGGLSEAAIDKEATMLFVVGVFYIWGLLENLSRRFNFGRKKNLMAGTVHKEVSTFMKISRRILLRMGNDSDKVVKKSKIHISCSIIFFLTENRDL